MAEIDAMIYSKKLIQHWHNLEIKFIPQKAWESDLLTLWRERIIFSLFFFAAVFAPFALIPSLILSFYEGLWSVFILDSVVYIIVLVVLFSKKFSLQQKTWVAFFIFYFLGTGLLFILGFYGGGYIWLFGAALIVGAMIGIKGANIALLINFLSLVSIGVYIAIGSPEWASAIDNIIQKWVVMTANFMSLNVIVTLLVAMMLNSLKVALTREQKTAIELREKREELMAILKASPDPILVYDSLNHVQYLNNAFTATFGWHLDDVKGERIPFIPEGQQKISCDLFVNDLSEVKETAIRFETTRYTKDGLLLNISLSAAQIMGNKGDTVGIVVNMKDITEFKKMYSELLLVKHSIEHSAYLFEWVQKDSRLFYVNEALCGSLGYTRDELCSMHISDIDPDFPLERWPGFWKKLKSKKVLTFETRHRKKNGDIFPVEITANHLEFEGQEHVFAYVKDISERVRYENKQNALEKQLQQTQKMEAIGTLAGGIAHDFNNILSGIFGYSRLAQIHMENPAKANKHIEQIVKGAQRATDLTRQILTFSRQSEYQKQPFRIYLEIKEALKLLRSSIPVTIKIKSKLDSRKMVSADPIKIHQVIMNLCTNAYHAMRETGGCLTVSLTDVELSDSNFLKNKKIVPGEYIKLEVNDTGHGMDEKTLKRVFDPYFTTKEKGDGTGLGLALVQAIVEEHDGFLEVSSELAKGTNFYLYFPIVREEIKNNIPKIEKESKLTGNETIIVVDDEETIRESCKELLEDYGYQVQIFGNGIEAFEIFKKDPDKFDLIVTDMTMPGLTGDKLAIEMLKIRSTLPIILCTGFSENMSQTKAMELGIKKYVQKPIPSQDLMALVRELLDKTMIQSVHKKVVKKRPLCL